jgi:hypothetical protein
LQAFSHIGDLALLARDFPLQVLASRELLVQRGSLQADHLGHGRARIP